MTREELKEKIAQIIFDAQGLEEDKAASKILSLLSRKGWHGPDDPDPRLRAFCEGLEMQNIDKLMTLSAEGLRRIGEGMTILVKYQISNNPNLDKLKGIYDLIHKDDPVEWLEADGKPIPYSALSGIAKGMVEGLNRVCDDCKGCEDNPCMVREALTYQGKRIRVKEREE